MKTEPTPRPWCEMGAAHNVDGTTTTYDVAAEKDGGFWFVAECATEQDARLIVHAVNAHDALVAATESATELLQELLRTSASNDQADAIDEVLVALNKARNAE